MPERPPEFTDIDLDDEDEDEKTPAPVDAEPADPIDFDDEEDDVDLDEGEAADADQDGGALEGGAPHASAAAPAPDEDDDVDEDAERDGIQRAAAVLKYIVENIVDEPGQIAIGATTDDRGPVLLLRVAEDDRGKIIGRQGRIVQAIRTVVKAASIGTGERVSVEIID